MYYMRQLFECEKGAVTVDWVVLTASIVGLGFVVAAGINSALVTKSVEIGDFIDGIQVAGGT